MNININSAWDELRQRVATCQGCELCKTRANTVFGEGPIDSKVVIIGEAPGTQEDHEGRPFVGKAGELLTKILQNGGNIARDSVYITNIVKCWPPPEEEGKENGKPKPGQIAKCINFLEAQLLLLRPKIIVTMGNFPTQTLLKTSVGIMKLRGNWRDWRGVKLFPMFHPSFLLRNDARHEGSPKWLTNLDVKALKREIDKLHEGEMLINGGTQENPDAPGNNS